MSLTTLLHILVAPVSGEVQFNCPWCTTRLALPDEDFARERAVLCPRCNNPIDLAVQRRLAQSPTPPPPPASPGRRPVTTPEKPAPPQKTPTPSLSRKAAAPPPAPSRDLPPLKKKAPESGSLTFDPNKPIDIDGAFKGEPIHVDDIDSLMSHSDLFEATAPRGPADSGSKGKADGKVNCPSCGYENAPVVRGFEFGSVRKCTWCGKPLPE